MNDIDKTVKGNIVEQDIREMMLGIIVAFWNGNGIYVPKNLKKYNKQIL
jgi:hypothetical protein